MTVEAILSGKHIPNQKETKVAGYIESDVPRSCGTCEYLEKGRLCKNYIVLRDPKIPKDKNTDLKIVDPVFGCCNHWQSSETAEAKAAKGKFEKSLKVVLE